MADNLELQIMNVRRSIASVQGTLANHKDVIKTMASQIADLKYELMVMKERYNHLEDKYAELLECPNNEKKKR